MLKVGIASTWHVHADGYARELLSSGKAEIRAVWDENEQRGRAFAEKYGFPYVTDYGELLASGIDAVVCNAPTTMHFELLSKAAAAGKHIFTEKLLAATTGECEKLCRIIDESGVTFTVSLPLRCNGQMLYAKKLIDSGALGRISGARMRRSHGGVSDGWLPERWFDVSMTGGGAMMDLGAHPVYMLSFLFGAPKRVSSVTANLFGTSSDENAVCLAEFEGGIIGTCETAFVTYGVPDILEIYGTEGSLFIRGGKTELSTKALASIGVSSAVPDKLPEKRPSPLLQFIDACINGTGTPEHFGTKDALIMTKIIEAAYASDRLNKTIVF